MWRRRKRSSSRSGAGVPAVWVPASLLDRTVHFLRQSRDNFEPHEGVVYWAGRRAGKEYFITTCVVPSARTTQGSFVTSSETNAKVITYLASADLELLAQIHSHPGVFVGHSEGDDKRAFMPYEGFFSIVVPHYARCGMRPLTICGVHVFIQSRFRRLDKSDIESHFHIVDEYADLRE